jgi:hypothetical protein
VKLPSVLPCRNSEALLLSCSKLHSMHCVVWQQRQPLLQLPLSSMAVLHMTCRRHW